MFATYEGCEGERRNYKRRFKAKNRLEILNCSARIKYAKTISLRLIKGKSVSSSCYFNSFRT